MRGLIIKDFLFLKSTWKNMLVMFIGSLLLSIALGNYLLAICVVPIMLLTSGITTFQTDEFYNSEAYTLTMPVSRKQIIISRYLFTLIMVVITMYIGFLIYTLIHFTINPGTNGLNMDMLKQLFMFELSALIIDSIFYPVIYKYGCEKSKFVLMSIVMLLLGIGSVISVYVNVIDIKAIDFESILDGIQQYGIYVLSIIVIISLVISYLLSILFYRHRDF